MGLAFEITNINVITAAKRIGVVLTDETSEFFLEQIDVDYIEKEALRWSELEEQTGYAIELICLELKENEEFLKLLSIDKNQSKKILDEMVKEYMEDNPNDEIDIERIAMSYCEDYISSDILQKAIIDQAIFINAN